MVKVNRNGSPIDIKAKANYLSEWKVKLIDKKINGPSLGCFETLAHVFLYLFNKLYRDTFKARKLDNLDPTQNKASQVFKKTKVDIDPWLKSWLSKPIDNGKKTWVIGDQHKHPQADIFWQTPAILFLGMYDKMDRIDSRAAWRFNSHGRTARANYLSNFFPCQIEIDGRKYKSVEHYYQAMKFPIGSDNYNNVVNSEDAFSARDAGRVRTGAKPCRDLDDDQEMSRLIKKGLFAKFTNKDGSPNALGRDLIATGNQIIIEGNRRESQGNKTPGDNRWGAIFDPAGFSNQSEMISLTGSNMLGKMLMELRQELKNRV